MAEKRDPLAAYLDADLRLKQMPRKAKAREAALDFLAEYFAFAEPYTETQINDGLNQLHTFGDPALLRRELYDSHRFTRSANGRTYHRLRGSYGPVHLRPVSPTHDADQVAEALSWVSDYVEMETGSKPGPEDVADFFDAPPNIPLNRQYQLAILDAEGHTKGLLAALTDYPDPGLWFIGYLAIDIRARGQGYGQAALEWFASEAATEGATALRLCVIEENARGRAFWETQGFRQIDETPPWTAGSKTHRRFVLERKL